MDIQRGAKMKTTGSPVTLVTDVTLALRLSRVSQDKIYSCTPATGCERSENKSSGVCG